MSRSVRALGAVVLTAAAVPFVGATPAYAATSSEAATNAAYYYRSGVDRPDEVTVGQIPNITGDRLDGVAPGHLAVAVNDLRQEDKRSFLGFDLAGVPAGSTINTATVTLKLAENGKDGNRLTNVDPALMQACPADDSGFSGEDGSNLQFAPKALCDVASSVPTATPDGKAFTFDITAIATAWLNEANNGLALAFAKDTPFQVVFLPADQATLDIDYSDPVADAAGTFTDVPATFDAGASDTGTTDLGGGFDSGSTDSTGTVSDSGGFASGEAPLLGDASGAVAAPDTAAPELASAQATPTRRVSRVSEILDPTASFFIGGLLLAGVLALLSLIMGDPKATSASATGRQSRLSQALQARQRGLTV